MRRVNIHLHRDLTRMRGGKVGEIRLNIPCAGIPGAGEDCLPAERGALSKRQQSFFPGYRSVLRGKSIPQILLIAT